MEAKYRLTVKAHSYSNPGNQDHNGGCCDVPCSNDCDNYFEFCLRAQGWSQTSVLCPLGFFSSEGTSIEADSITFGDQISSNLENPLVFTGNEWQVSEVLCELLRYSSYCCSFGGKRRASCL